MYSKTRAIIFAITSLISANTFANNTQENCLAQTIYHESRGSSINEQRDIAKLVINRTKHNAFPKTICSVITQKNQFKWVKHKLKINDKKSWEQAKTIARETIKNPNLSHLSKDVVFFKSNSSRTKLANHITKVKITEQRQHVFYAMR